MSSDPKIDCPVQRTKLSLPAWSFDRVLGFRGEVQAIRQSRTTLALATGACRQKMQFKVTKQFSVLSFFLLLAWACRGSKQNTHKPEPPASWRRLNLVVVTIDTLRPDRLGCYGYTKIETPNLDRLA